VLWVADNEEAIVGSVADATIEGKGLPLVASFHIAIVAVNVIDSVAFLADKFQGLLVVPVQLVVVVAVGTHKVVAAQGSIKRAADDETLAVAHGAIADALAGDGSVHGEVEVGSGVGAAVGCEQQVGYTVLVSSFDDTEVSPCAAYGTCERRGGIECSVEGEAAVGITIHVVSFAG